MARRRMTRRCGRVSPRWVFLASRSLNNLAAPVQGTAQLYSGEATGLQSSAFTAGAAIGAPLAGFVMDHSAPGWGFAVSGSGGVVIAALAVALTRRRARYAEPASASAIS